MFPKDDTSQSLLINLYSQITEKLDKVELDIANKGKELEGLMTLKTAYEKNHDLGDPASVHESWLEAKRAMSFLLFSKYGFSAQIEKIKSYLGGKSTPNIHQDLVHHFK